MSVRPKTPTTLEQRIAMTIRLLASDRDGEIIAAVHALRRTLASAGTDLNGLARGIENLGKGTSISNEERKKIWDTAVQHTENRLHGADEFIDKVASQVPWDREPTERMHKYLFSLFLQLGGKII